MIGIVASFGILMSVIIYSFLGANQLFENFTWVEHTYKVQHKLEIITSLISEAESLKRGYLITGQKDFLHHYMQTRKQITHEIVLIEELKKSDKPQLTKLMELENLIIQRLQSIDSLIALKSHHPDLPIERFSEVISMGKVYMHNIRVLNNQIADEEDKLLLQRKGLAYNNLSNISIAIIGAGFWSLVIICLVIFIFRKDVLRSNRISKELRELDAQKNKFFSIISHDLRNPVNAVKQLSAFLRADPLPDGEVKVIGKMIDNSILKVSNLLEDLLNWGRLQMNRVEFKLEKFDLGVLVNDGVDLLHQNALIKNIKVNAQVPIGTMVEADRNMIQTVIRNLLSNAIKFTLKGGSIDFTIKRYPDFIKLIIADNGIGMDEIVQQNLFRIDKAQSQQGTENEFGTGLGLILCKEFVEKNGGTIEVESQPNKGTTIFFTIPVG